MEKQLYIFIILILFSSRHLRQQQPVTALSQTASKRFPPLMLVTLSRSQQGRLIGEALYLFQKESRFKGREQRL